MEREICCRWKRTRAGQYAGIEKGCGRGESVKGKSRTVGKKKGRKVKRRCLFVQVAGMPAQRMRRRREPKMMLTTIKALNGRQRCQRAAASVKSPRRKNRVWNQNSRANEPFPFSSFPPPVRKRRVQRKNQAVNKMSAQQTRQVCKINIEKMYNGERQRRAKTRGRQMRGDVGSVPFRPFALFFSPEPNHSALAATDAKAQ